MPSANRERVGFMSTHRTVKIFWLHFKEATFILICCIIKKRLNSSQSELGVFAGYDIIFKGEIY